MHRVETVTVEDSPMEVFLFSPEGDGPHPGILLAQHIPGGHSGLENDPFTLKTAAGVPHTFHRYDGAGHAFQMFNNEERYREQQSEEAWKKLLALLDENLN